MNFDEWVINHNFKCAKCDESVQGFQPALDHMIEKHEEIEKEGQNNDNLGRPSYPCILCSMTFGRRELVKKHLQGRVSVQGVKSLGGHFACLCRGFEFYEVKKFLLLFFKKKMEILL